jgi:glutamate-5-semialdehyde dehydrogenase
VLFEPVAEASQGRSLSLSRCGARRASLPTASIRSEVTLREDIEREARAANEAVPALRDDLVSEALRGAAALVRERRGAILAANAVDVEQATGRFDEGTLDRLRLDDGRVEGLARQLEAMAEVEPLAREVDAWTLPNGLRVSERRIPIGTVGANFEARPNVALDVAGQLLKSLNTAVLRTGGAALGTVTTLVDDVLRPALEGAGLPSGAVGLVRTPDHEGARVLVSMPRLVPLVILRGSGETTAALARLAAESGVRTLAHAEGGGVLYVHGSASREKALALAEASLDRLGVCNRLNLALIDRAAEDVVPALLALFAEEGLEVRGAIDGAQPLDEPLGHEWASDPGRVSTVTIALVDGLDEAVRIANEQTSGLAAGVVAEDEDSARRFLDGYRGTAAFWHATTRFTDGFELTGAPETGINVDWAPGPRGPVTYRDLWLRQYRVVGDGTQTR